MPTVTKTDAKIIGENVTVTEEGDDLVIRFNKNYRGNPSASGKTIRVASSEGNVKVTNEVTIGFNAYVKA